MGKGIDMESDDIFCGGSKLWAQIISWIHTISNGLALLLFITCCVLFFGFEYWKPELDDIAKYGSSHYSVVKGHLEDELDMETTKQRYFRAIGIWFGLCIAEYLTGFIVGIILIVGVQQGSPAKLTIWMLTVAVTLILSSLIVIYTVMATGWNESIPRMVLLFVNYFCIWPVNTYRKQLMEAQSSRNPDSIKSELKC